MNDATEDDWGKLLIASLRSDEAKKVRERIYLKLIEDLSEEEVDVIQRYYRERVPQYIRNTMPSESQYWVLTVIGCDLGMYKCIVKIVLL